MRKIIAFFLILILSASLSACSGINLGFENDFTDNKQAINTSGSVTEDGSYTSKEEVALYLHTYGKLPSNYLTKRQANADTLIESLDGYGQAIIDLFQDAAKENCHITFLK